MTIKILPPQLANQIAAGEVVERPASVVKELVENALDAGATKIDIEIEKGGHKRILIRDNGKGIDKAQLTLALSRHATSKIADIDDLEAISSLGFRGEALASISSVSRLTMTSKPAAQSEAWAAMAEGLDMDVNIKPAAHPNGTSVEVIDLFFNTPARRKFLRAEKTEFSHIETLIKRIALSRADVTFTLKHNQKVVKRYRGLANEPDETKRVSHRIAEVINKGFVDSTSVHGVTYEQVNIQVWVKQPQQCVSVNPAQYAFVNGRMMRDKLIQHAIRQAFANELGPEQQPEYVIFISLPAQDVDVNVHPAKHEVRFHYARLLHDLIVKTIQEGLAAFQTASFLESKDEELVSTAPDWLVTPQQASADATLNQDSRAIESRGVPVESTVTQIEKSSLKPKYQIQDTPVNHFPGLKPAAKADKFGRERVTGSQLDAFAEYASASNNLSLNEEDDSKKDDARNSGESRIENNTEETLEAARSSQLINRTMTDVKMTEQMSLLLFQQQRFAFIQWQQKMFVLDTQTLVQSESTNRVNENDWLSAPLLVPVRIKLTTEEMDWCHAHQALLTELGFEIKLHSPYLIVKQVPNLLRRGASSQALPQILTRIIGTQDAAVEMLKAKIVNKQDSALSIERLELLLQDESRQREIQTKLVEVNPVSVLNQ